MTEKSNSHLWRHMPPALFPSILGLVGLGLAWQHAGNAFGFGNGIGVAISLVAGVLLLVAGCCYGAKFFARPSVIGEDLAQLPGRMGLSALSLSLMLLTVGIARLSAPIGNLFLLAALVFHAVLLITIARCLARLPRPARQATPAFHLTFAGYICAVFASIALGHASLAIGILVSSLIVATVIYGISGEQLKAAAPPAPLRPLLFVHLAPISLFATAFANLNIEITALMLLVIACVIFLGLVANLGWIIEAGFSPLWAAFTFPTMAFAGMLLVASQIFDPFRWVGMALLLAGSIYVPWIALRLLRMWVSGVLAQKTGAARA